MFLSYIDESGDDGFPKFSSPVFVLTACYFNEDSFTTNYNLYRQFRIRLRDNYNLPVKIELHLRELIQLKKPYTGLGISKENRQAIVDDIFDFIANPELDVKFISVVVDKTVITSKEFDVLNQCLMYLLQRIHNDMEAQGDHNFLCISDKGRVAVMNKIARKLRRFNYVPSKINQPKGNTPLNLFLEDILEKDSRESPFIQLSDCVSRIVNLYALQHLVGFEQPWIRKTLKFFSYGDELRLLNKVKSKLNIKAASNNEFGIKCIP